jgi:hypothetical protein
MDKKIKTAAKKIQKKIVGSEKTVKGEFNGLLKEDKKLDSKRDKLEKEVAKKKK